VPRGGSPARFDQQPIEATSLLLAATAAHEATGERRYADAAEAAYAWYVGANDSACQSRSRAAARRSTASRLPG